MKTIYIVQFGADSNFSRDYGDMYYFSSPTKACSGLVSLIKKQIEFGGLKIIKKDIKSFKNAFLFELLQGSSSEQNNIKDFGGSRNLYVSIESEELNSL